jgi:hypothetical protein
VADLGAVRTALAGVLGGIANLRVSPVFLAQVNPPAAVIMPNTAQPVRFDSLGGGVSFLLRVVLLVAYTEDASSQALMDGYLSSTGAASVEAAVAANPTLSGAVQFCNVDSYRGYGLGDWAGQQYLQAQIMLTAAA